MSRLMRSAVKTSFYNEKGSVTLEKIFIRHFHFFTLTINKEMINKKSYDLIAFAGKVIELVIQFLLCSL